MVLGGCRSFLLLVTTSIYWTSHHTLDNSLGCIMCLVSLHVWSGYKIMFYVFCRL